MTRTGRRGIPVLIAALAGLALAVGVFTTHAQPAHAQDATITSLLSRLDAELTDSRDRQLPLSDCGIQLGNRAREPESGVVQLSGRVQPLVHD